MWYCRCLLLPFLVLTLGCDHFFGSSSRKTNQSIISSGSAPTAVLSNTPSDPSGESQLSIKVISPNTVKFLYKLGPGLSTDCSDSSNYSAPISATGTISDSLINFPDGLILLCVLAEDGAGLRQEAAFATTYLWYRDASPPNMEAVNLEDGGTTSSSTESPLITWTTPSDDWGSSLVDHYDLCLGSSGNSCDIVNWVNLGLLNFHQFTSLSLVPGSTYYVQLRATDSLGRLSETLVSRGFRLNKTTDLATTEKLWNTRAEGTYSDNGAAIIVSRGAENGSYDAVFHNLRGSFYVSKMATDLVGRFSADGNVGFFVEDRGNNLNPYELWSFDSITKQKHFISNIGEPDAFFLDNNLSEVYVQSYNSTSGTSVWRKKYDGSQPQKITTSDEYIFSSWKLSIRPDSSKLAFLSRKASSTLELYTVNHDGTAELKILADANIAGNITSMASSNSKIFILGSLATATMTELWSMNWDGSGLIKLNATLPANANITSFFLNPNRTKVYYKGEQTTKGTNELWEVNPDGTGRVKVNGPLVTGGEVALASFSGTSASNEVLTFYGDVSTNNVFERFFIPKGSSTPTRMHPPLSAGGYTSFYLPRANSQRLITSGWLSSGSALAFYSINVDGTDLRQITPFLGATENLRTVVRSFTHDWLFYTVQDTVTYISKTYRVDSDGQNFMQIPTPLNYARIEEITIDDSRLIMDDYSSESGAENQLMIDPTTGEVLSMGYYSSDSGGTTYDLNLSHQGSTALYETDCTVRNLSVNPTLDLFPWKTTNGCVQSFQQNETTRDVIALGSFDSVGRTELFLSRGGQSIVKEKINATTLSSISTFSVSSNGVHLLYVGDSQQVGNKELWYVNLAQTPLAPRKLIGAITIDSYVYKMTIRNQGDFAHVLSDMGTSLRELYRVNLVSGAVDRVGPPVVTNATENSFFNFYVSPGYNKIALFGEFDSAGITQIRMADATSTLTTNLSQSFEPYIYNLPPQFSPDENHLLVNIGSSLTSDPYFSFNLSDSSYYNLSANVSNVNSQVTSDWEWVDSNWLITLANFSNYTSQDIYKIKSDGTLRVQLTPKLTDGQHIDEFKIFPSISEVVYLANTEDLNKYELFSVNLQTLRRRKVSIPLADGQTIPSVRYYPAKNVVVYKVVNLDLTQPKWYIYRLDTDSTRIFLPELTDTGKIIGDVHFNETFDYGIFTLFDSGHFKLWSISF